MARMYFTLKEEEEKKELMWNTLNGTIAETGVKWWFKNIYRVF